MSYPLDKRGFWWYTFSLHFLATRVRCYKPSGAKAGQGGDSWIAITWCARNCSLSPRSVKPSTECTSSLIPTSIAWSSGRSASTRMCWSRAWSSTKSTAMSRSTAGVCGTVPVEPSGASITSAPLKTWGISSVSVLTGLGSRAGTEIQSGSVWCKVGIKLVSVWAVTRDSCGLGSTAMCHWFKVCVRSFRSLFYGLCFQTHATPNI